MNRRLVPVLGAGVLASSLGIGLVGCELDEEVSADTDRAASALEEEDLVVETMYDTSAAPVFIQIRACSTSEAARTHVGIDCRLDPEYALVGGGAQTSTENRAYHPEQSFLTESRPLDGRTWRASSSDHLLSAWHNLTVYAIGMRLEGANTQRIREAIRWSEVEVSGDRATLQVGPGWRLLSGGGSVTAEAESAGRLLSGLRFNGYHEWETRSTDHLVPAGGVTTTWMLELEDKIIEGFGALEIKQLIAPSVFAENGLATSSVEIESGWGLIGVGGFVDGEAPGRMLVGVTPSEDGRSVTATSSDYIDFASGTTTAYAVMARKVSGSHGLCSPGSALLPQWDGCVADICQQRPQCCSGTWDEECVGLVEPVCGRSCAEHTCVPTVFEPERWNYNHGTPEEPIYTNSGNVASNCANYALNTYGGTKLPGDSLDLLPSDQWSRAARQRALLEGEGLIPTTYDGTCSENRTKVYWGYFNSDFHMRRLDADGTWSEKWGSTGPAQEATSFVPTPGDGAKAYFCACNVPLPDIEPPFTAE